MSKMDNLRAMREARYAAAQQRAAVTPARPAARPPVAPPAPGPTRVSTSVAPTGTAAGDAGDAGDAGAAEAAEALCGHRNISGRTCTREHGHAAKTHRYS